MKTQHFSLSALFCLFYLTLTICSSGVEVSNKFVKVEINAPADISQFTRISVGNDFYFIGKAKFPTVNFNVNYKVTLVDAVKCKLVKPQPAIGNKMTTGGVVTDYIVESKVTGEKKIEGKIYFIPVEIKVNNTGTQEDDFVAVSAGTDEDLATDFSVKITGADGITGTLKVKPAPADGDIKFKDTTLNLPSGVEVKTKLWGKTPSSAKDTTIIEVTLKKGYKVLAKIDEDVTVFEGITIKFDGTFVANVDARPEKWRPWTGDGEASAADINEYLSKIKFQSDDQGGGRRAWTKAPKVTITDIQTIHPPISLNNIDIVYEAEISMLAGRFEPAAVDDRNNEHLYHVEIEIRKSKDGDKFSTGKIEDVDATPHSPHPGGGLNALLGWETRDDINERINIEHGGTPYEIRDYYVDAIFPITDEPRWTMVALFLSFRQQWENEKMTFSKSLQTKNSIAMKGILGKQETKTAPFSSIRMDLQRYNIWYLSGEIKNGIITTDPLP